MSSAPSVLIDGVERASIEADDRGLAYGDGLFETVAVAGGVIINWPAHVARLTDGCSRLELPAPDPELLRREILAVATGFSRCVVKLIVTRGSGGIGYTPPATAEPRRIVLRRAWPDDYATKSANGITIGYARHRLSTNVGLAGVKHLNRLDQVLASREMQIAGWDEALMCDANGRVIEATRSNLFAVIEGDLVTPALDTAGVAGIMRGQILALAPALDLSTREILLSPGDVENAAELFVCNAIAGVWPVVTLFGPQRRAFGIGPVTRSIRAALARAGHPA